ncbi:uncharacterized protein PSFLO_01087 [Pseudozyma flocculosa]|uniref:Uncharacterized protein n=1 Tax=Pseudozyma flocculosa TaxID=84751 RepID=A0A5C3EVR8_9BASI|nr:uncharacterized protein PSFLO_01087 [Pseudozyma flocculosa]
MSRSLTNDLNYPSSINVKKAAKLKGSPSPSRLSPGLGSKHRSSRLSPGLGSKHRSSQHRSLQQRNQRGTASPRLSVFSDDENTPSSSNDGDGYDDDDYDASSASHHHHLPGIKLPVPTRSMQQAPKHQRMPHKKASKAGPKKERVRRERKSAVRKQRFDELESDSDLTDIPSSDDEPSVSRVDKGKARSSDLALSDSDTEMEKKLLEAGDGESLLGSDGEENELDESRFIIRDALKREARARAKVRKETTGQQSSNGQDWSSRGDTEHRARSSTIRRRSTAGGGTGGDPANVANEAEGEADVEDGEDEADADLLSLSPDAMRLYGLPYVEDEIFEEQEGFRTSSEPSFTDFFETSTDSETAPGEAMRDDDDEFTTDSDTDEDISDLESGVLEAPLIAHVGTAQELAATHGDAAADATAAQPDVPLLVIEDLDGRLIYARAGDGEAVFGSDGEFEFVDDTDDDSTDYEYDEHGNRALPSWASMGMLGAPEDDGDTTDELPDEDMPYPRLLVGSVAPRGGRNSRRARALAAKSRMLSPASGLQSGLPSPSTKETAELLASQSAADTVAETGVATLSGPAAGSAPSAAGSASASPDQPPLEVDLTISTDDLARDPEGTLRVAAEALGLTLEEAANLVAGVQLPSTITSCEASAPLAGSSQHHRRASTDVAATAAAPNASGQPPRTPDVPRSANFVKPEMGSFMPTSSKSIHRAVIDGSKKAPSPFSGKRSLQKKGLAKKRTAARRSSLNDQLSKRQRRFSSTNDGASTIEELSEVAASSPEPEPVDPMDLDDVVNANMLWRGNSSKSPSPEPYGGSATENEGTSTMRSAQANGRPGLNLNAFARWDKIPMGTFRDSQRASSAFGQSQHQQPLGTFLLTRSHGRSQRRQEHSPFRTPSAAAGDMEMFSMSPIRPQHQLSANDEAEAGQGGGRRRPFVISPVLFPTRSGDIASANGRSTVSSHGAFSLERHASMPQGRLGGVASVESASNNSAGPGRITRREKRERKARRAALLATRADNNDDVKSVMSAQSEPSRSPHPITPQLPEAGLHGLTTKDRSDSPATALPRMRITDASPTPRASPAPAPNPAPATYASVVGMGPPAATAVQGALDPSSAVGGDSSSSPVGGLAARSHLGHVQEGEAVGSRASLLSSSGGLPSSACKTPLHSPLFGGIFGNMVDDLDDRDGENALSI